ncbi:MAG: methyltransferase [Planctomycetota bacterium]
MKIQDGEHLLEVMRGYQVPCVIAAAIDLGVFDTLSVPRTGREVSELTTCDERGMTILLDALAALGFIRKEGNRYRLSEQLEPLLLRDSPQSVVPMLRHQASCLRRWTRLPWTIKTGSPGDAGPSPRGEEADQEAFIQAMHVVSRDVAPALIPEINPGGIRCILDLGGASGSWTLAWLDSEPGARAIIFDLPHVIPMAKSRVSQSSVADRVDYVAGDFYSDPLPSGVDLAWVSAIIHQNSRKQNRDLFARIAEALEPPGWIYIRDVVLDASRTSPVAGALFAVNMLAATEYGNSYTFEDIESDLRAAGFGSVELVRRDPGMHSIVRARLAEK